MRYEYWKSNLLRQPVSRLEFGQRLLALVTEVASIPWVEFESGEVVGSNSDERYEELWSRCELVVSAVSAMLEVPFSTEEQVSLNFGLHHAYNDVLDAAMAADDGRPHNAGYFLFDSWSTWGNNLLESAIRVMNEAMVLFYTDPWYYSEARNELWSFTRPAISPGGEV